jgi:chemotaxis protein CheX
LRFRARRRLRRENMMAKPSAPRRRSRKIAFAKGEYYPKVDLSDLEDRLPSSWSPSSVVTPAEEPADEQLAAAAEPARVEEEVMPPPVVYLEPPVTASTPVTAPMPVTAPTPVSAVASAPRGAAEGILSLPASLDLPAARPLAAALLERRGQPTTIDASAVGQIGAQCVQVLLSAKRTWEADGVSLSIVNCALRMIEDLKLIGIERTLVSGELPK